MAAARRRHRSSLPASRRRRPNLAAAAALLSSLAVIIIPSPATSSSSSSDPTLDEPFQTSFLNLPHVPCVSLYHRFGRVGCGTLGRSNMNGRIVHWSDVIDSDGGGGSASKGNVPPYVAVMDESEYTSENVAKLMSFAKGATAAEASSSVWSDDPEGAGVLRGVLVINSTSSAGDDDDGGNSYNSPAPQTPRGEGTPSEQLTVGTSYAWNANGDGLTIENMYGLPSALVVDSGVSSVLLDVSKNQGSVVSQIAKSGGNADRDELYPAIVAEFNLYMGQEDLTSKDCLAWRDTDGVWRPKCLPLGGNSVWATAGSPEVAGGDYGDGGGRKLEDASDDGDNRRPVVLLATNLDATSMFHDASPGANAAASNILALLMAAKLLGANVDDATLDGLPKRVVFAFFQAENYGYVGSRTFLRDLAYPGFKCDEDAEVPASAKKADSWNRTGCLHPLRPSMDFAKLGKVAGMIAVDQVGAPSADGNFYVHGENAANNNNNDGGDGDDAAFLANVLLQLGTDDWTISSSSVGEDDDGDYPLPPTPLTSLVKLSEGAVGGAVLAGYDDAFANNAYYQSHLDSNATRPVDINAIATAATVLARAALASAYDNGEGDAEGAAQYASNLIPALESDDETLLTLAHCLFEDGNCETLLTYGKVEEKNAAQDTGVDLGMGDPLGTPPSYYPSIYDASNGQGFVKLGKTFYGSYTGDDEYGKDSTDTFLLRPNLLEMSVHGLLNDFLGRGGTTKGDGNDGNDDDAELVACEGTDDCSSVPYCASSSSDRAVCAGSKVCVCSRANYHPALDEALVPAPNNVTGYFLVRDGEDGGDSADEGISAMYTEPFWSWKVGVHVYRDAGGKSGNWALGAGLMVFFACFSSAWFMRGKLKKEKLY